MSEPDALLHWQTDFNPDPSVRQLPEDYPVNNSESPIAPLDVQRGGRQHRPLRPPTTPGSILRISG